MKKVIIIFCFILSNHLIAEETKPIPERKPSDVSNYDHKSEVKKISKSDDSYARFYRITNDEDKVVCYSAVSPEGNTSISCVKK
ncbi:MAG: hypothetical protein H7281_08510 [Bacteriovorax sp.]|nr:hypothetical protein [Bacteriovorax sp.]